MQTSTDSYSALRAVANRLKRFIRETLGERRSLIIALLWYSLVSFSLLLLIITLPARYAQLQTLSAEEVEILRQLKLSARFYAIFFMSLEVFFISGFLGVAFVIFWRQNPPEWMPTLASLMLVTFAVVGDPHFLQALLFAEPAWNGPITFMRALALGCALLFWYLFPNGRFVPRWGWLFIISWAVWVVLWPFSPALDPYASLDNLQAPAPPLSFLLMAGFSASSLLAQIYRYKHASTPLERQQTKWVAFGITIGIVAYFAFFFPFALFPSLRQPSATQMLYSFIGLPVIVFCLLFVPLSITVAIFHYRLWDFEFVVNRALVFSILTAAVIGLYGIIVGALGALFQTRGSIVIAVLATALVAILFHPLREWLQRQVNQLIFGQQEEPVTVLARLGQRLEAMLTLEDVLPTIAQTVARALRSPYVAIALKTGQAFDIAVEVGMSVPSVVKLPLIYQSRAIGLLIVAPPSPGEFFRPGDSALLESIASQASAVVYNARLATDLQQARQRLITAREEERRRLRRDLHDGLGPILASQGLKLAAIQQLLSRNPGAAADLLEEVLAQNEATVANIRHLVYKLRPPVLDELGLAGAIQNQVLGAGGELQLPASLHVTVEEPAGGLPSLPAAAEVAAYHIALEAVTNVIRHAAASHCLVRLHVTTKGRSKILCITIRDDGVGLPDSLPVGVGLVSMRDRAEEIGGTWKIEAAAGGGTQVVACLPLETK